MYVPGHFGMDDGAVQELLVQHGAGDLVTTTDRGLVSTLLPFVYDPAPGAHGSLLGHFARTNDHWRLAPVGEAMVILRGPDAYITPRWYASKREHGRVVPTWNYSAAHLSGPVTVHDDPEWLREAVTRLTDHHEGRTADKERWHVDDAPARFVDGQLRAIVGVSMAVTGVEAKAKLSQNRSADDQAGVVEGLAGSADLGAAAVRDAMARRQQGH